MSNLNLTQRLWQILDPQVQRALDYIANTIDYGFNKLNTALDFSDTLLTARIPVSAPTISSDLGFKTYVGPWAYYGMGTATSGTQMTFGDWGTTTFTGAVVPAGFGGWAAPFAGSILAISARVDAATAKTVTVTAYKNNVATTLAASGACAANTSTTLTSIASKNTWKFAAGDVLDLRLGATNGSNMDAVVAAIVVEMGA